MTRIALVGYGYWGPNVAKNIYKNKKYIFDTICDKRPERIEMAKQIYANEINYCEDYNQILQNKEIEAVALAVETSAHFELAKQALLAGKHVYIEKPFTSILKEAKELKKIAEEKNLIIHVDHIMVYHNAIKKIKEIIGSGEIGDIIYFDCSRLNLGNVKNDVSSMWDLGVHDLSIIDYLTNGENVEYVKAVGAKKFSSKESITFLTAHYETFLANIRSSWLSPIKERKLVIVGTKKMIVYDDVDVINKLIVYDKGFDVIEYSPNIEYEEYVVKARVGDARIPFVKLGDALFNSLEHFRSCVAEGKESLTGPDAAIRVIKILEMADAEMSKEKI